MRMSAEEKFPSVTNSHFVNTNSTIVQTLDLLYSRCQRLVELVLQFSGITSPEEASADYSNSGWYMPLKEIEVLSISNRNYLY